MTGAKVRAHHPQLLPSYASARTVTAHQRASIHNNTRHMSLPRAPPPSPPLLSPSLSPFQWQQVPWCCSARRTRLRRPSSQRPALRTVREGMLGYPWQRSWGCLHSRVRVLKLCQIHPSVGYGYGCSTKLTKVSGTGMDTCTRTRTRPLVFQGGRTRYQGFCRGRTELTKM